MEHGLPSFSIEQALATQRHMRGLLGLPDERFPLPAFIGMISDEIEQMRAAGRTDSDIADLIGEATGVRPETADIARYYAAPEDRHPD